MDGLDDVNLALPIEVDDYNLLAVVLRTARVARFLRSDAAERLASKLQWHWPILSKLQELWHQCSLACCCCWCFAPWQRRQRRRRKEQQQEQQPQQSQQTLSMTGSSRSRKDASTGGVLGTGAAPSNKSGSEAGGSHHGTTSDNEGRRGLDANSGGERRSSWGGLGMRALAAVKTREEAQKQGNQWPVRVLQNLGLMKRKNNEQFRRELAARRIQRAWRAVLEDRYNDSERTSNNDVAWQSTSNGRANMLLSSQQQNTRFRGRVSYDPSRLAAVTAPSRGMANSSRNQSITLAALETQRREVKVGATMRERTGQRVALGIMLTLIVTMLFTYIEKDATRPTTMIVLHTNTAFPSFANRSLDSARERAVPELFEYQFRDGTVRTFEVPGEDIAKLRPREKVHITVTGSGATAGTTEGFFTYRKEQREIAVISLLATIFILCLWFFGVMAFAGPVMMLVVIPIERMVRLLAMLMRDPLGYQTHLRYKKFVAEEHAITKNTRWTKEILKGMETSFLMSTILRIGNLLKVGFGSAGVEIIRKNLEKGQAKNMLDLNSQGSTVSCIFLFCDIRQFTDATECLQEEVFVFTNRIAAVVHSICNAYGGWANKNIGDAFLLSWVLDEGPAVSTNALMNGNPRRSGMGTTPFAANKNQADKALFSVVKICMSLHYDDYYIEPMTDHARRSLLAKLASREGPVVQMGFGLHAGSAVQGAIGSQRKIDATYVSEAVERAEFLESSTKKYGVPMLMSDSFHSLLQTKTRGRCRKIDQIRIKNDDDDDDEDDYGRKSFPSVLEWLFALVSNSGCRCSKNH